MSAQLEFWDVPEVRDFNERLTRVEVTLGGLKDTVEANRQESRHDRANLKQMVESLDRETEKRFERLTTDLRGVLDVMQQAKGAKDLLTAIVALAGLGLFSLMFQLWQLVKH